MKIFFLSRHKNIFINFGLVMMALLTIAGIFEIILRVAGFNPFGEFFTNEGRAIFIQPSSNPQRIYEATPHARGHGWETDIVINSQGFRDQEYPIIKPAGTFRIVVIGDSITFGNRIPSHENYPAVLESLYQQAGKKVEVLNLGLGGYDTLQEVATLEDIGLKFKPDLVIVGYCINDIGVASGNANYTRRLQKYGDPIYRMRLAQFIRVQLDRIELKTATEKANRAESFAQTYQNFMADIHHDTVLHTLMNSLKQQLQTTPSQYPFAQEYTDDNHIRRLRFAFEQLHSLQYQNQQKSFDVMVILFPFLLEEKDQSIFRSIHQLVTYEASRLNFNVMDLQPVFSAVQLKTLMIEPDDGIHPNAQGHFLTAQALFNTINILPQ